MYDDVKLMRDRSSTLFSEEMQTKMKEITDRIDIARPELMGDGTSSFYPPSMKEAEGLVTQLILKYMSLPQEFHNPYSTLDPVKFDSLITGPRCQGETGEQIRKLAKVLLGTMNLGKDCNFTPRVLMPGSTGTGKTSLIFELAESMGAHLIRFNSRQVKEDIEDHQYFTAFRSFAPQINIHSPEIDTPLMDALRMSGVKNPWILIDEFPGRSRLTASLKDLLDQEHSKLGRAIIFIVSNDSIADFDPALVARCIVVPFGKVSRSSKAAVYDKACGTKELPENYIPPYSKIANSIFRLDFSTLAWSEVLQTIPCINQALTPEQVACQKESREKAKQVLLEHRDYVLEKDQDNGVRTVLVTAGYITGLVIGDYPTESSASAKASCASEYLYYDIRRYIDEQAESNKEKMERLMAVESRMYTEGSSGSDSEDDD